LCFGSNGDRFTVRERLRIGAPRHVVERPEQTRRLAPKRTTGAAVATGGTVAEALRTDGRSDRRASVCDGEPVGLGPVVSDRLLDRTRDFPCNGSLEVVPRGRCRPPQKDSEQMQASIRAEPRDVQGRWFIELG